MTARLGDRGLAATRQDSAFAVALLDPSKPLPAGLTTWNGSDPVGRFAVYRNNVVASLVDALAAGFPVTCELVGDAFFRAMAREFVTNSPPSSPLMFEYGVGFAAFIADFEPAADVPYLADVARIEYAFTQSAYGADADPIEPDEFSSLLADPGRLPDVRFEFHPTLEVVRCRYAAVSIWAAHQDMARLDSIDWSIDEDALIVRPRLESEIRRLPPGVADFIDSLRRNSTLGEAMTFAAAATAQFDLQAGLGVLVGTGIVTAIIPNEETRS